jgi:fermentation-respiration switch protein FrsA (DUF1100 family)
MNPSPENPRPGLLATPWLRFPLYILLGYVGLVSMLLFFENWLVFPATTAAQHWQPPPPNAGIQDVYLPSADGTRIHAWWCPAEDSDLALLYCHGNAGNLSHRGQSIVKLRERLGVSVLIIDYPGYGKSEGSPTEQGCYLAADAAYAWLTDEKKIAPKKIILYGGSLGGGVVTDLASRKDHRALVLIKTFTSMPDVASSLYWWLPAPKQLLMRNRFDNQSKIGSIHRPVFVAHGTADTLIPHSHGVKLFEAANEPKRFYSMPGGGHNDGLPDEFFTSLRKFLQDNPVE